MKAIVFMARASIPWALLPVGEFGCGSVTSHWRPHKHGSTRTHRSYAVCRVIVDVVNLFFAGILAGEEFVIRYGVCGPLATLDDRAHIQFRQGLIRTLRVLVPAIAVPAFIAGIAAAALDGTRAGTAFRWAGVFALSTSNRPGRQAIQP
jgi:hypothetical protein